jgi:hypothetical protein
MKQALAIPPGVVRGATPGAVPGRWYDANFVRWHGGQLRPLGGWERITSSPLANPTRAIIAWYDNDEIKRIGVGTDEKLYVITTDTTFDATPVGFVGASSAGTGGGGYGSGDYGAEDYGDARDLVSAPTLTRPFSFSLDNWGEDLFALASSDGKLYRWTPTAPTTVATVVATAPTGNRGMWVTPERHCVLAGYNGDGRTIAWCSREDYTDWSFVSTTNTAGTYTLESRGLYLSHCKVREGTLIFTDADLYLMRYIGQPFVYGFDPIGETLLMSPRSVVAFAGGRAAWLAKTGFQVYEGGSIRPLPSDVSEFILNDIDPIVGPNKTVAVANGVHPEVWWFYPSSGAEEVDRYVIWNYEENWWSIGALGRTAGTSAGAYPLPIMAGTDNHLYQHETGWTDAGLSRVGQVWAECGTLRLSPGADNVMAVMSCFPDCATGAQNVSFTFGCRLTPDGAETAKGPYVARTDGYMDVRFAARDVRLKVMAVADEYWSVGTPMVEIKMRGKR